MDRLKGVGVALITPFKEDFSIDYASLENLLSHVSQSVDYLLVMGTTAESPTLSSNEKREILQFVIKNNPKNLPVVYGLGGNNTEAIAKEIASFDVNVDAFLSVSPTYNKPSQIGIIKHFERIADASNHPIILYNVPGRTSSNMEANTTLTLATHPNIIGIKEASGSIIQSVEISKKMPKDFLLLSGDDIKTFKMIKHGACGVISVIANALPKEFTSMVHEALSGNEISAIDIEYMESFDDMLMGECNPSGVKAALHYLGICQNTLRLPLTPVSEALDSEFKNFISKYLKSK